MEHIYSVQPEASLLIGDPNKGHVTNYYFGEETISEAEVKAIQKAVEANQLDVLNTRVEKHNSKSFTIHVASADIPAEAEGEGEGEVRARAREREVDLEVEGEESPPKLKIKYGDYSEDLKKVVAALTEAKKHAANEHQMKAIGEYIKS